MQITANKSTGSRDRISAFFPSVRHLPNGHKHMGFVCDAPNPLAAQVKLYGMATNKMPIEQVPQDQIFTLEF